MGLDTGHDVCPRLSSWHHVLLHGSSQPVEYCDSFSIDAAVSALRSKFQIVHVDDELGGKSY